MVLAGGERERAVAGCHQQEIEIEEEEEEVGS